MKICVNGLREMIRCELVGVSVCEQMDGWNCVCVCVLVRVVSVYSEGDVVGSDRSHNGFIAT